MSDLGDNNPPYHLVNQYSGKHIGPFSSYLDAAFARTIGEGGWSTGTIMNKDEFNAHIARRVSRR